MYEVQCDKTGELLAERRTLDRANETSFVWLCATGNHARVVERATGVIHSRTSSPADEVRAREYMLRAAEIVKDAQHYGELPDG